MLIPALTVYLFPVLLPCEIEIQHIHYGGSIEHLTRKHVPVVSFSWSAILRADLRVGKGKGQKECPAKTTTVLGSSFEHSAAGCLSQS